MLDPQEWRGADNTVLGYSYPPAPLPFATGRAFLTLLVRTTLSVLLPTGEASLFGDADRNRAIYVNAIFDRKADCVSAIDILHRH